MRFLYSKKFIQLLSSYEAIKLITEILWYIKAKFKLLLLLTKLTSIKFRINSS